MFEFDFKFDGDKLKKDAVKAMAEEMVKKGRTARCPEHGRTARITATVTGGKIRFDVQGCCCDKLKEAVNKKLAGG